MRTIWSSSNLPEINFEYRDGRKPHNDVMARLGNDNRMKLSIYWLTLPPLKRIHCKKVH